MPSRARLSSAYREFDGLPTGWTTRRLGEICTESQYGLNPSPGEGEEYPLLRMNNLQAGKIDTSDLVQVRLSRKDAEKYRLHPGDLLVNRTNSSDLVGKTALFNLPGDYVFASYLVRFRLDEEEAVPEYVNYYCNSHYGKHAMQRLATKGVSQANINPTELKKWFMVPLPPLIEQRKIAEILGTWDQAIELTERLIEAKRRRKKGLMQQLLTGKRRFKEFEGQEWREVRLGEVAEIRASTVDKKTLPNEVAVRLCNYMDAYENDYITDGLVFMEATATAKEVGRYALRRGDVVVTKDSETREDIAAAAVVDDDIPNLLCGYHLAIVRPRRGEVDGGFLAQALGQNPAHSHFARHANGAIRYGLTISSLSSAPLSLPPLAEQQAIVGVLRARDHETDLLNRKLALLREQKKGLMQQLLTGKVRVKGQTQYYREG